ncbi:transcriptional regulator, BadM/Rrf2 family [Thiohalospira halophila DSM 15071]|uniref:Transcriptional regulator, BadM/Rrf2 family n=1 Tax=Thiohalospira halophila DSM 15071 TaxID=1123397 RepID=A0A1I1QXH9_9GAMM|nr:Rrf2 family transcriptional regulator [Thiohalospira halophila]SFD22750.1 transcriptional regulator, BadM/Rrf2 family [Thiohalospira halophila DSM 15071]
MRLSTKGRYAVTAMMDLAIHEDSGPVTLADISLCQDISLSYLEQLMSQLRRNDLVRGMRGPGGGYSLARPASEISVAEIISAVDEPLEATRCGGEENCQEGERCLTHELWNDLSHRLYEFLDGITLDAYVQREDVQEVIRRQKSRQGQRNNMRRIRAA